MLKKIDSMYQFSKSEKIVLVYQEFMLAVYLIFKGIASVVLAFWMEDKS